MSVHQRYASAQPARAALLACMLATASLHLPLHPASAEPGTASMRAPAGETAAPRPADTLLAQAGTAPAQGATPAAPAQGAAPPPPVSTLPGGASSVQETYQNWQVACVQQGTTKRCALSQQQIAQQTRQRLLLIELVALPDNKAEGALVLPFGLALDSGVTLQVDEGPVGQPLRFRTCLPAGCIVPLSLDAAMIKALRGGTTLKLSAVASEGGAKTPFAISLAGFAGAYDRVLVLRK